MMAFYHIRSFNLEALLRALLLMGFSTYILTIIHRGNILLYLHPRLIPFLYLAILLMMIMALVSFFEVRRIPRRRIPLLPYTIFLIPLLLAVFIPPSPLDSHALVGRSVHISTREIGEDDQERFPTAGGIVLDERTFSPWFYELYRNPIIYQGTPITIKGFIFREEELEEAFYISRFLMVCCVADMQLAGLLSEHPEAYHYAQDQWVEMTGSLALIEHQGRILPYIQGEEIQQIARPEIPYVYPYQFLPESR